MFQTIQRLFLLRLLQSRPAQQVRLVLGQRSQWLTAGRLGALRAGGGRGTGWQVLQRVGLAERVEALGEVEHRQALIVLVLWLVHHANIAIAVPIAVSMADWSKCGA